MDKDRRRDRREGMQSASAAADKNSRLRMDSERNRPKPLSPPRRKELDNVMKKARRDGSDKSQYWNKKLLEAEEKDPNRWRHSGYKELYGEKSSSQSKSRSRSRSPMAKRPPPKNNIRARSPPGPSTSSRGRRSRSRSRSPARPKPSRPAGRGRPSPPPAKSARARSPSASSDSLSSCSDDSCSVCSPKHGGGHKKTKGRSRSRSFSVPRSRPAPAKPTTSAKTSSVNIGRKPPPKPIRPRPPVREKPSPPRDPRPPASSSSSQPKPRKDAPPEKTQAPPKRKMLAAVKIEGQKKPPPPPESDSDESSSSSDASGTGAPKMTLSERFGKMAQWSVDRRDIDYVKNMKITKESDSSNFKVVIDGPDDEEIYRAGAPEFGGDRRVGAGYFPEAMVSAPVGLSSWDDVRVRYKYYKGRGYLRDLSLDDYMKWEEWWYKYQEWLEAERYYEHWANSQSRHSKRRYRSKHSPID